MSIKLSAVRAVIVALGVALALMLGAGVASAQTDPYVSDSGQNRGSSGNGDAEVLDSAVGGVADNSLALTGTEVLTLAAIGGGLVVVGAGVVVANRRRTAAA